MRGSKKVKCKTQLALAQKSCNAKREKQYGSGLLQSAIYHTQYSSAPHCLQVSLCGNCFFVCFVLFLFCFALVFFFF